METLQISMLGEFSIRYGDKVISDAESRSKKVWSMIAYLIYNRHRSFSQQKLIDLLWGGDSMSSNPENAMRVTLHRARSLLDQLYDGAGHELIARQDGAYCWGGIDKTELDCDRFLELVQAADEDEEKYLQNLLEALKLYQGNFLSRHSAEMWVIPASTHFLARFLSAAMEAADLLSARGRHEEAVAICQRAIDFETYHEPLYQRLMQNLAAIGDIRGVTAVFEKLRKRLSDDFDIEPSEETQHIFQNISVPSAKRELSEEEVQKDLHEPEALSGAMQCSYEHFKVLCFAESRSMERNGNDTSIALINIPPNSRLLQDKDLLESSMEMLGDHLRKSLRLGDIISRCSTTQFIVMLPKANYENGCIACRRVLKQFHTAHPDFPEKINFIVQPLTIKMRVP